MALALPELRCSSEDSVYLEVWRDKRPVGNCVRTCVAQLLLVRSTL